MSKPQGIIVFGANGSGKTTLGRKLAHILDFKHMDAEDYYFRESKIPYTDARSKDEVICFMLADIEKHRQFIISTCVGDLGNIIPQFYGLAVHISVPLDIRMERIKRRAYDRFGDRVCEGGDMYEQQQKFHDFVLSRPLSKIDQWAQTLTCPVICIDGTKDLHTNAITIVERFNELYPNKHFCRNQHFNTKLM